MHSLVYKTLQVVWNLLSYFIEEGLEKFVQLKTKIGEAFEKLGELKWNVHKLIDALRSLQICYLA